MKVVQINATCGVGSTGKICHGISQLLDERGDESYILYTLGNESAENKRYIKYGNTLYTKLQAFKSRLFGNYGFNSKRATKRLIRHLEKISPDIVHLHNIHSHDCDLDALFSYFKKSHTRLVWTLHDCWPLTGYCPHFTLSACNKWETECGSCPRYKEYSFIFDKSAVNHKRKKDLFSDVDLTTVTPSAWLADIVRRSFLKDRPLRVINNGIDTSVFKPTESGFRQKYGLDGKFVILGVAFAWSNAKGLDVFIELAKKLPQDKYAIVLVGTDDKVDKLLPSHIISIHKTKDQASLAQIYTACDLFVNPTREEVFGLVNVEALACGTPVVTFASGGSPECIDNTCGITVPCGDIDGIMDAIVNAHASPLFTEQACIARASLFDIKKKYASYVELYYEICNKRKA